MKKLLIILLLSSCASVKPTFDYQAEGKQPVNYKKQTKQTHNYIKVMVIAGFVGYFISENYDTDPD